MFRCKKNHWILICLESWAHLFCGCYRWSWLQRNQKITLMCDVMLFVNRASNFVILLKTDYSWDFNLLQWNCCFENCCCDGWRSRYKLSALGAPTDGPYDVFCADNWVLFPAHPDQKSLLKNKHCSDAYYTAREWIAAGIFELPKEWQDQDGRTNIADILTTIVIGTVLQFLVGRLMWRNQTKPPNMIKGKIPMLI